MKIDELTPSMKFTELQAALQAIPEALKGQDPQVAFSGYSGRLFCKFGPDEWFAYDQGKRAWFSVSFPYYQLLEPVHVDLVAKSD